MISDNNNNTKNISEEEGKEELNRWKKKVWQQKVHQLINPFVVAVLEAADTANNTNIADVEATAAAVAPAVAAVVEVVVADVVVAVDMEAAVVVLVVEEEAAATTTTIKAVTYIFDEGKSSISFVTNN